MATDMSNSYRVYGTDPYAPNPLSPPENLEVEIAITYEEFKKSVIEEYNSIKGSLTKEILFFEKYKKIPLNYGKPNVIELMYS